MKFYPSNINSLLLLFLCVQERTLVGGREAPMEQDIQLSGLGIQPEHCVITIEGGGLFMEPLQNARSYVNGLPVTERIPLHHGDRILWGNHHFFRVNCPKSAGSTLYQNYHLCMSSHVASNLHGIFQLFSCGSTMKCSSKYHGLLNHHILL